MPSSRVMGFFACLVVSGTEITGAEDMAHVPGGHYSPPFQANTQANAKGNEKANSGREQVWVNAFRMDREPVTVGEYALFVSRNPNWRKSRVKPIFADSTYLASWKNDSTPIPSSYTKPVTQVSWYAAKAYCSGLGKRLSSTREWERVAQVIPEGQDSTTYNALLLEWYGQPAFRDTSNGAGSQNAFGIRDLFGKIWEWTTDFNEEGPEGIGSGDGNASFFCGGGSSAARATGVDYATYMRFAFRSSLRPEYTTNSLGFRCAVGEGDEK